MQLTLTSNFALEWRGYSEVAARTSTNGAPVLELVCGGWIASVLVLTSWMIMHDVMMLCGQTHRSYCKL